MGLDREVLDSLYAMGFARPMQVQAAVYRLAMAGRDLMVQSRTGSGKTAAFGIPFAQKLVSSELPAVQALILAPTRELALQVAKELEKICAGRKLRVTPIYGGAPMGRQIEELRAGVHIVAGTPGRVLDHLRRGTLKLDTLRVLVLDECDEMLSMGFQEEIEAIIQRTPETRQTLLFSATIPEGIARLARGYMREPERITLSQDFVGAEEIEHVYYLVSGSNRPADLMRVLAYETPESAIIFCNTRDDTAQVAAYLRRHGLDAEAISSDLSQADRERVMERTKQRNLKYLVATDIAARGIDISDLSHVINYTFPESTEVYIHRTGRTGRAGKRGVAISLIAPKELGNFYFLKLTYKIKPEERELPSDEELKTRREGERYEELKRRVPEDAGDEYRSLARRVWQAADGERIVAALIERTITGSGRTTESPAPAARPVRLESSAPARREPAAVAPVTPVTPVAPIGPIGPTAPLPSVEDGEHPRRMRFAEAAEHVGKGSAGASGGGRGGRAERERLRRERKERRALAAVTEGGSTTEAPSAIAGGEEAEEAGVPVAGGPHHTAETVLRKRRRRRGGKRREEGAEEAQAGASSAEERGPSDRIAEAPAALPPAVSDARGRGRSGDSSTASSGDLKDFWETWVDARPGTEAPPGAPVNATAASAAQGAAAAPAPTEEPGRTRLFINTGRRDGVGPAEMAAFLAEKAAVGPDDARLDVRGSHTYVSVVSERADELIGRLHGQKLGERELVCERARK
jgi:ATP-dependent RNA helicase DeaD